MNLPGMPHLGVDNHVQCIGVPCACRCVEVVVRIALWAKKRKAPPW